MWTTHQLWIPADLMEQKFPIRNFRQLGAFHWPKMPVGISVANGTAVNGVSRKGEPKFSKFLTGNFCSIWPGVFGWIVRYSDILQFVETFPGCILTICPSFGSFNWMETLHRGIVIFVENAGNYCAIRTWKFKKVNWILQTSRWMLQKPACSAGQIGNLPRMGFTCEFLVEWTAPVICSRTIHLKTKNKKSILCLSCSKNIKNKQRQTWTASRFAQLEQLEFFKFFVCNPC